MWIRPQFYGKFVCKFLSKVCVWIGANFWANSSMNSRQNLCVNLRPHLCVNQDQSYVRNCAGFGAYISVFLFMCFKFVHRVALFFSGPIYVWILWINFGTRQIVRKNLRSDLCTNSLTNWGTNSHRNSHKNLHTKCAHRLKRHLAHMFMHKCECEKCPQIPTPIGILTNSKRRTGAQSCTNLRT